MDVLEVIKEKVRSLPDDLESSIRTVITHLEVAEQHYSRGRDSGDEQLFTDVIYRCNHAFEGVLREAFKTIAGQDPSSKSVSQIESFFDESNSFRPRVLELFAKYRKDWRNPSTHDHRLFFSEGEALLALLSVQAFVAVVLDQLLEKSGYLLAYNGESAPKATHKSIPLLDRVVRLFVEFSGSHEVWGKVRRTGQVPGQGLHSEILGMLAGFLASRAPDLNVEIEPELDRQIWPDMLVSNDDGNIIVEVKNGSLSANKQHGMAQLSHMLTVSGIDEGILFLLPSEPTGMNIDRIVQTGLTRERKLVVLSPISG